MLPPFGCAAECLLDKGFNPRMRIVGGGPFRTVPMASGGTESARHPTGLSPAEGNRVPVTGLTYKPSWYHAHDRVMGSRSRHIMAHLRARDQGDGHLCIADLSHSLKGVSEAVYADTGEIIKCSCATLDELVLCGLPRLKRLTPYVPKVRSSRMRVLPFSVFASPTGQNRPSCPRKPVGVELLVEPHLPESVPISCSGEPGSLRYTQNNPGKGPLPARKLGSTSDLLRTNSWVGRRDGASRHACNDY